MMSEDSVDEKVAMTKETLMLMLHISEMQHNVRANVVNTDGFITVNIGIIPNHLEVPDMFFMFCGIAPDEEITISLRYRHEYLRTAPRAATDDLFVRQNDMKFGLWWPLEDRLSRAAPEWMADHAVGLAEIMQSEALVSAVATINAGKDFLSIIDVEEDNLSYDYVLMAMAAGIMVNDVKDLTKSLGVWEAKTGEYANQAASALDKLRRYNFLMFIADEAIRHILEITDKCMICEQPMPMRLLKPMVCTRQFCRFSMLEYNLGICLRSEIMSNPLVVDFMLMLMHLVSAPGVPRDVFSPFPDVNGISSDDDGIKAINHIIGHMPSVNDMQTSILGGTFEERMNACHPAALNLLKWGIATNSCHLTQIPLPLQLEEMNTPYQFVFKSVPPEKERAFRELRERHGSFFAWHGSPSGNWFSICWNGINNDRPKTQVYGPGTYLAREIGTSYAYCKVPGYDREHGIFGSGKRGVYIIALCEVIDVRSKTACGGIVHDIGCNHRKDSPYYRVEHATHLLTRFLFVFINNGRTSPKFDALNPDNIEKIRRMMD